jgi:hypothetical protein
MEDCATPQFETEPADTIDGLSDKVDEGEDNATRESPLPIKMFFFLLTTTHHFQLPSASRATEPGFSSWPSQGRL